MACRLALERAASLGCLLAVHALETVLTQDCKFTPATLTERFAAACGSAAAAKVAARLRA